jgi:hypothetical protein
LFFFSQTRGLGNASHNFDPENNSLETRCNWSSVPSIFFFRTIITKRGLQMQYKDYMGYKCKILMWAPPSLCLHVFVIRTLRYFLIRN